jgi:hypothetical protein
VKKSDIINFEHYLDSYLKFLKRFNESPWDENENGVRSVKPPGYNEVRNYNTGRNNTYVEEIKPNKTENFTINLSEPTVDSNNKTWEDIKANNSVKADMHNKEIAFFNNTVPVSKIESIPLLKDELATGINEKHTNDSNLGINSTEDIKPLNITSNINLINETEYHNATLPKDNIENDKVGVGNETSENNIIITPPPNISLIAESESPELTTNKTIEININDSLINSTNSNEAYDELTPNTNITSTRHTSLIPKKKSKRRNTSMTKREDKPKNLTQHRINNNHDTELVTKQLNDFNNETSSETPQVNNKVEEKLQEYEGIELNLYKKIINISLSLIVIGLLMGVLLGLILVMYLNTKNK